MWPWWVKILIEDFTDVTLAIGDTYGADVRDGYGGDGHGGWQGGWHKIPNEYFTDVTVAIGDTYSYMEMMLEVTMWVLDMEVDKVAWCPNFQLMQTWLDFLHSLGFRVSISNLSG